MDFETFTTAAGSARPEKSTGIGRSKARVYPVASWYVPRSSFIRETGVFLDSTLFKYHPVRGGHHACGGCGGYRTVAARPAVEQPVVECLSVPSRRGNAMMLGLPVFATSTTSIRRRFTAFRASLLKRLPTHNDCQSAMTKLATNAGFSLALIRDLKARLQSRKPFLASSAR